MCRAAGGLAVHAHAVDIRDEDALDELMSLAASRGSRLDCVFANAGAAAGPGPSTLAGRLEEVDLDAFRGSIELNLTGTLATMRAAVRPIRASGRGGRIIVTASVAGLQGDTLSSATRIQPGPVAKRTLTAVFSCSSMLLRPACGRKGVLAVMTGSPIPLEVGVRCIRP